MSRGTYQARQPRRRAGGAGQKTGSAVNLATQRIEHLRLGAASVMMASVDAGRSMMARGEVINASSYAALEHTWPQLLEMAPTKAGCSFC